MSTVIDTLVQKINDILTPEKNEKESIQLTDAEILQNKLIDEELKQKELINQIINEENLLNEKIIKEEMIKQKILEETILNPNIEFQNLDETFSYNINRSSYYNEFFGNNDDNFIKLNIKSKDIFILIILVLILYLVFIKN
jgi:hypothetical protein